MSIFHKRLSKMILSMSDILDVRQSSSSVVFRAVGEALSISSLAFKENAEPSFFKASRISSTVLYLKHSLMTVCIILSLDTSMVHDKLLMGHLSVNKLIAASISFRLGDFKCVKCSIIGVILFEGT